MRKLMAELKIVLSAVYQDPFFGAFFRMLNGFWRGLDRISFGWFFLVKLVFLYFTPWLIYRPLMFLLFNEENPLYLFFFFGWHRLPSMLGGPLRIDIWLTSYIFFMAMAIISFIKLDPRGITGGKVRVTIWRAWWLGYFISLGLVSTPWYIGAIP